MAFKEYASSAKMLDVGYCLFVFAVVLFQLKLNACTCYFLFDLT